MLECFFASTIGASARTVGKGSAKTDLTNVEREGSPLPPSPGRGKAGRRAGAGAGCGRALFFKSANGFPSCTSPPRRRLVAREELKVRPQDKKDGDGVEDVEGELR